MKKWLVVSEKIVAVLLLLYGLTSIISVYAIIASSIDSISIYNEQAGIGTVPNILGALRNHSDLIFVSLFALAAGILLFMRKRIGWMLAIAVSVVYVFSMLFHTFFSHLGRFVFDKSAGRYMTIAVFLLLALVCLFILTRKEMLQKYQPGRPLYIFGLIVVLFLFFLRSTVILNHRANQARIESMFQDYREE